MHVPKPPRPRPASITRVPGVVTAHSPVDASQLPEIELQKHTLVNGLDVLLHEDHKLPFVCVNLWYHVGSKDEDPGRTGFAHLFEHMMFQGSKHIPGDYISNMEKLGANLRAGGINGTTSWDRTNYFETVPSPALERVLWMESDRMAHLLDALTQEKLDNQRDVVKNERRQGIDNVPYGRAWEIAFASLLPEGHPYSWPIIGSMDDLDRASLADVSEFFRTFYTPNNCSIAVVGDIDPRQALSLVEAYFGSIPPGPALERRKRWVPELTDERHVVVRDKIPQERVYLLYLAAPAFDGAEPELDVLAHILASGKNARLYKRLVYEEQTATNAGASNLALEIAGVFAITATARPGVSLDQVQRSLDDEVAQIAASGPSPEELERSKADLEFDYLSGLQRIGGFGGKADILNRYNTFLGDPGYFKDDYERYRAVDAGAVQRAARAYLTGRGRLVLHYVPERSTTPAPTTLDRSRAPAVGTRREFEAPPVAEGKLDNGVRVLVIERPELPLVSAGLFLKVGARFDPVDLPGVAWLTASMLDEGTDNRNALEISADIQRLGSHLSTSCGYDGSLVSVEALRRNLEPTLEILADVVLRPSFPANELERLRKQRLDGILQERADARSTADRIFRRVLFGGEHPYGHERRGARASIEGMSTGDLVRFYRATWSPAQAALVLAGNITLDDALGVADRTLGGWSAGAPSAAVAIRPPERAAASRIFIVDRPGSAQTELRIGLPGPPRRTEGYCAIELMKTILGGSFSSRLNLNLREEKGYTYSARAAVLYNREAGQIRASAAVESKVTAPAVSEFIRELRGIAGEKPVTHEELEQAKDNLIRGYAQHFESLAELVAQVGELVNFELPLSELGDLPANTERVSLAEVQRAAAELIDPDRLWIVAVGDSKVIESPLRELGVGEVTILDVEGEPRS